VDCGQRPGYRTESGDSEDELETGSASVTFDLTHDHLRPIRAYKIDLYLDGTLTTTVPFEVQ
jgi:hypothetical protein